MALTTLSQDPQAASTSSSLFLLPTQLPRAAMLQASGLFPESRECPSTPRIMGSGKVAPLIHNSPNPPRLSCPNSSNPSPTLSNSQTPPAPPSQCPISTWGYTWMYQQVAPRPPLLQRWTGLQTPLGPCVSLLLLFSAGTGVGSVTSR